ncbi:MAG: cytochrome c [Verrucomicrobiota bacterium]|jgi:mono/diheme cytochrome c family protein
MSPNDPKQAVQKNGAEPVAGFAAVPLWLIVVFGGLFYWSQLYLDGHAGGFNAAVYAPYRSFEQVAAVNPQDPGARKRAMGREVFEKTCAACHQLTGLGKEGVAPPLVGSEWVLAPGGGRIARVVLNGLTGPITVKGQDWNLTMPPWRDNFDDEHLAAVLTYIRSRLGDNKAADIDPALVKAARAESHPGPETTEELLKIPLQ